ncbi:MAG: hypothetical protein FJ161_02405 [Gammaproteobacteria bacterium]|nr:hypothetical protein [Gammaproteobacteria bacterium]
MDRIYFTELSLIDGGSGSEFSSEQQLHGILNTLSTAQCISMEYTHTAPLPMRILAQDTCIINNPGRDFSISLMTKPENGAGLIHQLRLFSPGQRVRLSFVKDQNGIFWIQPSFISE